MFFGNVPFVNGMCARSWTSGEHVPGLPNLILFWANDVSVVRVFRCELTRGMLSDERVLALISMIMTGGLPKIVSNWAVLTLANDGDGVFGQRVVIYVKKKNDSRSCTTR